MTRGVRQMRGRCSQNKLLSLLKTNKTRCTFCIKFLIQKKFEIFSYTYNQSHFKHTLLSLSFVFRFKVLLHCLLPGSVCGGGWWGVFKIDGKHPWVGHFVVLHIDHL